MKRMKKLFVLLLAVVMMMGLSVTAFAAGDATIVINNANKNESYKAYKLFDMTTSGSDGNKTYSYFTKDEALKNELVADYHLTFTESAAGGTWYVKTTTSGAETVFVTTTTEGAEGTITAAELAVLLKDKVEAGEYNGKIVSSGTSVLSGNDTDGYTVTINGLDAGYYFVTTTMGSLCILDTTGEVDIEEKNEAPEVDKNATTSNENGTAQVGDTVNFTITITAKPGAENYVLHDQMSEGLTLNNNEDNPIIVKVGDAPLTEGEDYTVNYSPSIKEEDPNCVFEVTFAESYLNSITEDTVIVITYSATVNAQAVAGKDPETNQAILDYGDNSHVETEEGKTETYTYDFTLKKVDGDGTQLAGAQFKLYDKEEGGSPIQFIYSEATETYRVATADEIKVSGTTTDTITVGSATVTGLAGKTYWLEEIVAPEGYNLLEDRVQVDFVTENAGEPLTLAESDLKDQEVENEAGSLLPSTGGMGTTLIYIAGAVLVIGAGVLLVVRRRMNAER